MNGHIVRHFVCVCVSKHQFVCLSIVFHLATTNLSVGIYFMKYGLAHTSSSFPNSERWKWPVRMFLTFFNIEFQIHFIRNISIFRFGRIPFTQNIYIVNHQNCFDGFFFPLQHNTWSFVVRPKQREEDEEKPNGFSGKLI